MIKYILFKLLKAKKEIFPKLLSIELSSSCNAKCIMCPHPTIMTRKKMNMSAEILEKIIADCQGKPVKKINLFWFGDSLCSKHVIDHFRAIRKGIPQAKLYLSSNSEYLTEERSQTIIDEGLLDVINFDIDGATEETHFKIRKISLNKVKENIDFFLNYQKTSSNAKKIQTRATIIHMTENQDEIERFKEEWGPKVDKVDVNKYNTWLGDIEDRNVNSTKQNLTDSSFDFACIHPWDEMVISSSGEAGLCCLDYDLRAPLGNVMEQSIHEIWRNDVLKEYRQKMLEHHYEQIEVCKNCNAHIFQQKSMWAKLQK